MRTRTTDGVPPTPAAPPSSTGTLPGRPSATVVVPTFDRAHHLELTLRSLERQSRDDFEVVVVDDGSRDATKAVAERFARALRLTYVFQPDEGFRVARARNLGVRLATAPTCVSHPFLDGLDPAACATEVGADRARLRAVLGVPVDDFAYPFGRYTDTVVDAVRRAGYRTAVTTSPRDVAPDDSPLLLPRVCVESGRPFSALVGA